MMDKVSVNLEILALALTITAPLSVQIAAAQTGTGSSPNAVAPRPHSIRGAYMPPPPVQPRVPTQAELTQELEIAKAKYNAQPDDAKARYGYAEALRKLGRNKEAAVEYLQVTEAEPTFYHAYHQLTLTTQDRHILDEALGRLNFLKEEKPRDLLLRVALSEIYERKGDYFMAGKVLVDLVYANAVPEKYNQKVSNRIRLMQAKAKDSHALDKASGGDDALESAPPPLPESTLNRDLSISKVKEPRVMQGFGHATLLP